VCGSMDPSRSDIDVKLDIYIVVKGWLTYSLITLDNHYTHLLLQEVGPYNNTGSLK
jgi:hypothetical protein